MTDRERSFVTDNIDVFCCPRCRGDLNLDAGEPHCPRCAVTYPVVDGIPRFFTPNEWDASKEDITDRMKAFYEENPFPSYDDFDNVSSLIEKARTGLFAKLLDEQVPFGTRVIECGCGTGQLTNFLSVANRTVVGADLCLNSLKLGHAFKTSNHLNRAHFMQMNLFRPCFREGMFDLVISNGVLHHTSDPFGAFQSITRLVKPNGYVLIGLYHQYGRLVTDFRRWVFKHTRDRFKGLDGRNIDQTISKAKRHAWFMDQYKNPHESKHTVGEVLHWLERTGFTFVHSIPKSVPFVPMSENEQLFVPERAGNWIERAMVDLGEAVTGFREGGFFIVIARKPG